MNRLKRLPCAAIDWLAKSWLVCHSHCAAGVRGTKVLQAVKQAVVAPFHKDFLNSESIGTVPLAAWASFSAFLTA